MKRARFAIIVALGVFALASCDVMLETLFPDEFATDEQGGLGRKTIVVTVFIDQNGAGYYQSGAGTVAPIEVIAVQWSFDNITGLPTIVKNAAGNLDTNFQFVVPHDGTGRIGTGSVYMATSTFTIRVPNGNWGVFVFEDVNLDGMPSAGESTVVASWAMPPTFIYGPEEFDFFFLEGETPPVNSIIADDVYLLHHSNGGTNNLDGDKNDFELLF